jgi:S1-C subfamily serine protease
MIHGTRRSTLILALIISSATGPALAQSSLPPDLSGKVLPSFVTLSIQTADGRTAVGTGFLAIKDGLLATAWHLVKEAKAVVARFPNGEEFECSGVVDKDEKRDVAIIRIRVFGKPILRLEPVDLPPGTPVAVAAVKDGAFGLVGASLGETIVTNGVKNVRLVGDVPETAIGAPVVDAAGNVIGQVALRAVEGKTAAFAVPAAYLLGLDVSLATQPWGTTPSSAKEPTGGAKMMTDEEVDTRLGQGFMAVIEAEVCLTWAWELSLGQGYLSGVPSNLYQAQQTLETASASLAEIRTAEELRLRIGRGLFQILANQKAAGENFIRGIVTGQQAKNWIAQADDALKRANSLRQAVTQQIAGLKADLTALEAASAKFREFLPFEQRYSLGLAQRPSGYRLGVSTYPRNPFALLVVNLNGFGDKIGLRPGDVIVSAAGKTYTGEDDFEDFKLLIKANLGKTLPVVVKRGGKDQTVNLKIPKEIPADAFYVN